MQILADENQLHELINQLAQKIAADIKASGAEAQWALVGIRSRGDLIAQRVAEYLGPDRIADRVGALDITLYRDDLSEIGSQAVVRTTEIPFSIDGLNLVLIDDVLMTGRSIRAALNSLMDFGRARRIWLSVLVDRGGRELPITPDHAVLDMVSGDQYHDQLRQGELVDVCLTPYDECDQIVLRSPASLTGD